MAGMFSRRSALTAAAAAVATIVTPFAGQALGAPEAFSGSNITTQPAPSSSNVVQANRPTIIATFSDDIASSSTISLTAKGSSTNLCNAFTVNRNQVSCTPTSDLALGTTYDAMGHGVRKSDGAKAATKQLAFTVDYPKFDDKNSSPNPDMSVVQGNETLTAKFNEQVTGNTDTSAADGAFKVFEVNADGTRGTQLPGTVTFPSGNPVTGSPDTVTFSGNLANGKYEAVLFVYGVDSNGNANKRAIGTADYYFYVDNSAPQNLQTPDPWVNNENGSAFPFTGTAAPGLTVTVSVPSQSSSPLSSPTTNSTTVAACDTAPNCPWTVTLDLSGYSNTDSETWTAQTSDAANKTGATGSGPSFGIHIATVPTPTITAPAAGSTVGATFTVTATDSGATSVTKYQLTGTDSDGNSTGIELFPAAADHSLSATFDASVLDDGSVTVLAQAEDAYGNVSAGPSSNPLQSNPQEVTVTKQTPFVPLLQKSTITNNGSDTTLTDAAAHPVGPPSVVTLEFAQTVELSYTDSGLNGTKHNSSMCLATPRGNCAVGGTGTLTATSDGHGITLKLSSPPKDGTYSIVATTFDKGTCPSSGSSTCETFSGQVMNGSQPLLLTVDSTPPTVVVSQISPDPITASGARNVTVSGTVSSDVDPSKDVQLVLKSTGSKTPRQVSATVTPAASGASTASWSASGIDLSQMPDGTLSITATAYDMAGNKGTGKANVPLRAHVSSLSATPSQARIHAGHALTLSGRLRDEFGDPIASATVTVQRRYDGGKLGQPTTAVTDSFGRWSLLEAPTHNATFFASYAGTSTSPLHDPAVGKARVHVHVNLVITAPTKGSASSPVKVHGKVSPHKHGATVRLYRKTRHGWKLVGKHRLNRHSHFTIKAKLPHGKQRLEAKIGKTSGNLGDTSQRVTLHIH